MVGICHGGNVPPSHHHHRPVMKRIVIIATLLLMMIMRIMTMKGVSGWPEYLPGDASSLPPHLQPPLSQMHKVYFHISHDK